MLRLTLCASYALTILTTASALPDSLNSALVGLKSLVTNKRHDPVKRDESKALWLLQDEYKGKTFFDDWDFFTGPDPTNGFVEYVDRETAFSNNLAYVKDDGTIIMQGDNTTWLPLGTYRKSVRISSHRAYTGGLFILDLNAAPLGCGVWPAFWTLGKDIQWPNAGEIDIIEGVHDNVHNQVAWHTLPGCVLTPGNFTGTMVGHTECNAFINYNAGCGITDWSRVSYGETFTAQGGGMYAMKWDEEGISVWYFYRATLPRDILNGTPDPTTWPTPSAHLAASGCDPFQYFYNHAIVFDITFCGDWAGNNYNTNPECTGTCQERLMDPVNFVNASWSINSLRIFRKQALNSTVVSGTEYRSRTDAWKVAALAAISLVAAAVIS